MGRPVIVSKQAGAHEVVEQGKQGFVLNHYADTAAIASHIKALLDDTTLARMSKECLNRREEVSFERHVERLEELYEGVRAGEI